MQDVLRALADSAETELDNEANALEALGRAEKADPVPTPEEIDSFLPEKGILVGLHRLYARSLEASGDQEQADAVLLGVAERLNQARYWLALSRVTATLLDRHPHQSAPLLSRARTQAPAAVDDELLEAAHRALPRHGLLAWQVAEARQARGDAAGAHRAAVEALIQLIEDKNYETAEEALLLMVEVEKTDTVRALCRSLELLARQEFWELFDTILQLGESLFTREDGAAIAWPVVRELWRRHSDHEGLRETAIRVARSHLASMPEPEALIRISEMERPSQPPEVVLERLRRVLLFPPGYYARHSGWGIGKIRDNDTEAVVIDFPSKPLHRMAMTTAENALDALPPDDLRVMLAYDRDQVSRMVAEKPVDLVVLALRCLKNEEGTVDELRKILVPEVLASSAWASWWKGTRGALGADSRVDTRRAYENKYRIPTGDEAESEVEIPDWDPKKDLFKNLTTFDTFISHFPGEQERVAVSVRDHLRTVTESDKEIPERRVAAALWLRRNGTGHDALPATTITLGFDWNTFPKTQQEELLEWISTEGALASALNSRLVGIRRAAWARLESLDAHSAATSAVLEDAAEYQDAALHLLETVSGKGGPGFGDTTWARGFLLALLQLLENPGRETYRKRAMALIDGAGPLAERLRATPIPEEDAGPIISKLKHWSGSDRYRFPVMDFLREVGETEIVDAVEGHRTRAAAKLGDRMSAGEEDPYQGALVLTRPTYLRLEQERHRIGMELKTVIPQAIQKARELGDLKENAEYDAAKSKQANYAKRFEELDGLLKHILLIESLERTPGVAVPGTEITLEPSTSGESLVFWLLGEGDQPLGDGVVSYKAPVGKAIHGRSLGDEVLVPRDGESVAYRIVDIRERLPEIEES